MNCKGQDRHIEQIITSVSSPGIRPGLERITRLLLLIGNPHQSFHSVNVAGTNGKGSVSSNLASILVSSGYRTALYTSPHLESITERLLISGNQLSVEEWLDAAYKVSKTVEKDHILSQDKPSYFENLTAISFLLAKQNSTEIAILEAGMGGRLDATNHGQNVLLSVITHIAEDHKEFLGENLKDIALEKFAIINKNGKAVFAGQDKELTDLFYSFCKERSAEGHVLSEECIIKEPKYSISGNTFDLELNGLIFQELKSSLPGNFQVSNCSLSIFAALLLENRLKNINENTIRSGISNVKWPGRVEISGSYPIMVMDGAHNSDGMQSLIESIIQLWPVRENISISVVFASMKDKDYISSFSSLSQIHPEVYFTQIPGNQRSEKTSILQARSQPFFNKESVFTFEDPVEAVSEARKSADVVIICGSLYLLGYLRKNCPEKFF